MGVRRIVLEASDEELAEFWSQLTEEERTNVSQELGLRVLHALLKELSATEVMKMKERCLVSLVAQGGGQ